tara:strand:- start:2908 stop:3141 length:234 start_codon:yes stop_codon:yes gene_type:complete
MEDTREVLTIDIGKIRNVPNGSIDDGETIRQIAYHGIYYSQGENLYDKIDRRFEYCGLYPHIMKAHNIIPEKYRKDE